jgi:hypothetical protein
MTNWDLLRKVADRIERENRFDMSTYGRKKDDRCSTVACMAGHIVWMTEPERFEKEITLNIHSCDFNIHEIATEKMGISEDEADELFVPCGDIDINDINDNKNLVPAALRWMADNKCLDWNKAGPAVGFIMGVTNERIDRTSQRLYPECEETSQWDMA